MANQVVVIEQDPLIVEVTLEPAASIVIPTSGVQGTQGPQGPPGPAGIGSGGVGIPTGGTTGQSLRKFNNTDYSVQWETDPPTTGPVRTLSFFDETTGELTGFDEMKYSTAHKSLDFLHQIEPLADTNHITLHQFNTRLNPQVANVQQNWSLAWNEASIGTDNSGLPFGDSTNGSIRMDTQSLRCDNLSSMGRIQMYQAYVTIGNGTDPVTAEQSTIYGGNLQINAGSSVKNLSIFDFNIGTNAGELTEYFKGFGLSGNFGDVGQDATIFQTGINFKDVAGYSNAFVSFNQFDNVRGMNTFGDFQQVHVNVDSSGNYFSFASAPTIESVKYFTGLNVSPDITEVRESAYGINVNMDNVTLYPGVKASVTIQALTIEFIEASSFNNTYSVEYVSDVTAGSETAALAGSLITVHMQAGVSTANQIKAAIQANFILNSNVTVTGGGATPQNAQGPTAFAGGISPATKLAAYLKGDVQIEGGLTFTGGLSIGALNGFSLLTLSDGGGVPASAHSLISAPTCPANSVIGNADTLGVNTAALITIGDNSTITTAFLGVAALGLPAVLTMGTGATVDRVAGAVFAISLDAASGGGTVDTVALCRALALPNGITAVNRLYGYEFSLPFGDLGTDIWGLYINVASAKNWIAGSLKVGGADIPATADSSLEVEKLAVLGRGDTATRNSYSAINGSLYYNTDTDKFQGYAAGAWTDLH